MLVQEIQARVMLPAAIALLTTLLAGCDAMMRQNQIESAKEEYDEGLAAMAKGETDKAVEHFSEAIRTRDDYEDAYIARAMIYTDQEEYDAAIHDLTQAMRHSRAEAGLYFQRGNVQALAGYTDKAISDYSSAILLKPDFGNAYMSRGTLYLERGEIEMATSDMVKAAEFGTDTK